MAFTYVHVLIAYGVAVGFIALVLMTAPNLSVGTSRLRRIVKFTCMTVMIAGFAVGGVTLVWGFVAHSNGLVYFSLVPLVIAILTSNFMSRNAM
ncbi:MAG: hypothetical protein EOQ86_19745 [Mesorhizobium sp.]|uniref:hypothetical protein n=1 Tax=Mesorhizobium TaxID=68287 RepID=UPI000FE85BEF|nr:MULTISPECIES: hypothetical protein [Mesorhizobium]RWH76864.1 MAG: hypothetical protein EOQ85_20215 [Mesorhizobium sp.]RWH80173.1 MAG: hypothetical protein EOQ86_19745 [Mesorhizobium sp.]RWH88748.1 MAG: hypothetical protein EOQ87_20335 [Mesorhizobium sp.]RWH95605.1 MAG: hypothetical protein EOQ88_22465 [Mesorhizobium sp.]RWI01290.1 MAG: hypothetical protein EOQ89_16675 [Mesorhizobium sp.]